MGQLVAKFRLWCEKLKAPEKFKDGELTKLDMEQDNVSTSERNGDAGIKQEEGADLKPITLDDEEEEEDYEIAKKLEDVETVIESQAKLINEQTARIDSLEDSMEKVSQQVDQKDETLRAVETLLVKAPEGNKEEPVDRWQLLQEHARILEQHKLQLESQAGDIQNMREMLDDEQGKKHHKKNEKEEQKYEQLEKEVKTQLEQQQRLLDNLYAGFIVAFIIVVVICMLPRAVFPGALDSNTSGTRSFLDTFWALMTGVDQSPK